MIYFHLPGFYINYKLNKIFVEYFYKNRNYFNENIEIGSIYDSFPGCSWNGGRDVLNNYSLPTKNNIILTLKTFNDFNIPCRLTLTNNLVTEEMLTDTIGNTILKIASQNKLNQVLISSDILKNKIIEEYPNMKIISSTTKNIVVLSDLENELNNKDYFLVVPNIIFNNTKELLNISKPEKCEILLNDTCYFNCPLRQQHYFLKNKNNSQGQNTEQLECIYQQLKEKSFYELLKENPSHITKEQLYNNYYPSGFKNFKIVGRECNDFEILEFYLYYMAKPEYINEIRYQILRRIK